MTTDRFYVQNVYPTQRVIVVTNESYGNNIIISFDKIDQSVINYALLRDESFSLYADVEYNNGYVFKNWRLEENSQNPDLRLKSSI